MKRHIAWILMTVLKNRSCIFIAIIIEEPIEVEPVVVDEYIFIVMLFRNNQFI